MHWQRSIWRWISAGLASIVLSGCGLSSVARPASRSISATFDQGGFNFSSWDEGMQLMVIYDGVYAKEDCDSLIDNKTRTATNHCDVKFEDGSAVDWQLTTDDGKTGKLTINQVEYAMPENGSMIVIHAQNGTIQVDQVQRDLSKLKTDPAEVDAWLQADPITKPILYPEEK